MDSREYARKEEVPSRRMRVQTCRTLRIFGSTHPNFLSNGFGPLGAQGFPSPLYNPMKLRKVSLYIPTKSVHPFHRGIDIFPLSLYNTLSHTHTTNMNLVLSERDVVCLKGLIGMIVELCAYQSVVR